MNSVPQVFVGEGALDVTALARAFSDPERGASMEFPEPDGWELVALRYNAEYLLRLFALL